MAGRYRNTAVFHSDWRTHCKPLDRNAKARIMATCEALERKTKAPGRRNGVISVIGLMVLRCMLYRFHNSGSGLLCPSYAALQAATGLCKQSIATAIARLEVAGVLSIVRRLCRQYVRRQSPVTGEPEVILTTTQASSLYAVSLPGAWAEHVPPPLHKPAPFPSKRQMDMLKGLELLWQSKQGTAGREITTPTSINLARLLSMEGKRA